MSNFERWPLLIFDLDGTLLDSAKDIWAALNRTLIKHNRQTVDLKTLTEHIGDGLKKLVHDFFPEYGFESAEHLARVDEFLEDYRHNMLDTSVLYPDVKEFLLWYPGPIALVTNKNIQPTHKLLNYFDLAGLDWVDVIGGDSLPERKPSPLPLQHVMSKAQVTPLQSWMIGDGRPDMQAAQAAGCVKVAALYGYSPTPILESYNPDYKIHGLNDLKGILLNKFKDF